MINEVKIQQLNKQWGEEYILNNMPKRDIFKKIKRDLDNKLVSFLTGSRRIGKSTLMMQSIDYLINTKKINPKQILFYEFDSTYNAKDIHKIYTYFIENIANKSENMYIFFDEIQFVNGYENEVKFIYDLNNTIDKGFITKIFITGSLSLSYKKRMQESMAGRFINYKIYPLNFKEYLLFKNKLEILNFKLDKVSALNKLKINEINKHFKDFLKNGAFPQIAVKENVTKEEVSEYIQEIINQSLSQDAFDYFDIANPKLLISLFNNIRQNNGLEISESNLSNVSGADKRTISKYLDSIAINAIGLISFRMETTRL